MCDSANEKSQPALTGLAHDSAAPFIPDPAAEARPDPMHAERDRDHGMEVALHATTAGDRAAIVAAVLAGLDPLEPRRAEEALARVRFAWPSTASPRALGALVAHLARRGRIREEGWVKGRTGRSRAGRVSLWTRATP